MMMRVAHILLPLLMMATTPRFCRGDDSATALQYASAELKGDREIVIEAVKQNGGALWYASAELKGDREIVIEAVKQNGNSLQCASAELKGDREIVMEAVKQNGNALVYASAALKGDREIVMVAVARLSAALMYAAPALRNGGLKAHLEDMTRNRFTVPKETFIATILFGAKATAVSDAGAESSSGSFSSSSSSSSSSRCVLSKLQPSISLPGPFSTQIKRLIWGYAGVRNGPKWRVIEAAAARLGVSF